MGVYIKGMEMPDKCGSCPCFHAEHPIRCQAVKADKAKRIAAPYGLPRPDWCPLGEISPHGRLIDADELQRQFERMANEEWNKNIAVSAASCFDDAAVIVEDAPTIIEAEE